VDYEAGSMHDLVGLNESGELPPHAALFPASLLLYYMNRKVDA
jgi:hypothetical protein